MPDRRDRGKNVEDALSERFKNDQPASDETAQTDTTSESDKTTMSAQTSKTGVKERPSVLMYLPEELRSELDVRFDELNARHKREHGEGIEKNRDYYPAVVEAGLTDRSLEDILDI